MRNTSYVSTSLLLLALLTLLPSRATADEDPFADPAFRQVWERSDKPVAEGRAGRSWTWGPQPLHAESELYKEAPDGRRQVQYFDKARMEINNPDGNRNDLFFVTNGRLVVELLSGRIQTGENRYESGLPAKVPIAGDTPGGYYDTPTYATLYAVANIGGAGGRAAPVAPGTPLRNVLTRGGGPGTARPDAGLPEDQRTTAAVYVPETGHNIPVAFWNFLNQRGPVYENGAYREDMVVNWVFAFGYPITEAYWTGIQVRGTLYPVLFQAFERRVLTFNPANPAAFQVEMGNVGRHYHDWRYATPPLGATPPGRGFGTVWVDQPAGAVTRSDPITREDGFCCKK